MLWHRLGKVVCSVIVLALRVLFINYLFLFVFIADLFNDLVFVIHTLVELLSHTKPAIGSCLDHLTVVLGGE